MKLFKKLNDWFEKWFAPIEIECSNCGEKYLLGIPEYTHKCELKKVIKKAILELEDDSKLGTENKK